MTAPRRVLPGTTYLVTRRCSERRFFLRPDPLTTTICRFVLALAAWRHGVRLHAFCFLSNHFHLVLTDPHARLPAFMQLLDSLVGRAVNASRGRWDHFWEASPYSAVILTSPRDVVEKAAYVLANPVAAGLVRRASDWPGLWSAPHLLTAEPEVVERPEGFFRRCGLVPTRVQLHVVAPHGFASSTAFRTALETALAELEARHRQGRHGHLGAACVLRQKWWARPQGEEPRRGLSPRVAGRVTSMRIAALSGLREFLAAYREAWERWRRGDRRVLFPPGTYALRVVHGAACFASG